MFPEIQRGEHMARLAQPVVCDEATKEQLIEITKSRKQPAGLSLRAKIILQALSGARVKDIAQNCGVCVPTVICWKRRFNANGIAGLYDEKRSGRPPTYGDEFKQKVLKRLEEAPPAGYGQWDGELLGRELGYSKHAIWRLLREQRIRLARSRSWCISTDPEFVAKAADVVGLYLSRDDKAVVVCVDEKPNMQALERRTGYAVSSDDKLVHGFESTYKRNGTVNLFAALEVSTGKIHGKTTDSSQKTKLGFLSFMDELLLELPSAEEYHVILDNHSIHKNHKEWLAEHENVYFHYTPTSASWLNMVEIWLGILSRKSLRGASFANTQVLCEHIRIFIESYNQTAEPFVWKKREVKGAQLTNTLKNFCN
jgi:transposase